MEQHRPSPQRILVVDDERAVRESLSRVLQLAHYETSTAASGREAAAQLAQHHAAVTLLDVNMAEENGWETARQLATLCPQMPVMIMTARPHETVPADVTNVAGIMEKPLDLKALLGTVAELSRRDTFGEEQRAHA